MRKIMKYQFGRFNELRLNKPDPQQPDLNQFKSPPGGAPSPIVSPNSGEAPRSGGGSHSVHATPLEVVP
jgi:hypothetical protein